MKKPCCMIVAQLIIQTFLKQHITVHAHLEKFKTKSFINTNYSSGKGDFIFSWMLEVLINSSVMNDDDFTKVAFCERVLLVLTQSRLNFT